MSTVYSPKIPTNNCQIFVDWANPKCYPGSGTTFTNLIDKSRNAGYLKGSVTTSTDPGGNLCLYTPGGGAGTNIVGDRIDINTSASGIDRFNNTMNFSHVFWVRRIGNGSKLLSTGSSGATQTDNCIWQMWIDGGQYYWWNSSGGGAENITSTFTPCPNTTDWFCVGMTYSHNGAGNNVVSVYRDGVLQNTGVNDHATHSAIDRTGQTNMQWTLGGGYNSSCVNVNSAGYFGMYALYNETLSATEILQFYHATRKRFGK